MEAENFDEYQLNNEIEQLELNTDDIEVEIFHPAVVGTQDV